MFLSIDCRWCQAVNGYINQTIELGKTQAFAELLVVIRTAVTLKNLVNLTEYLP